MDDFMQLAETICRQVHIYEWVDSNGHNRMSGRSEPCLDCLKAADAAEEWWRASRH